MIYFKSLDDAVDAHVKRHCAPLFSSAIFAHTGHNAQTVNATVTFVRHCKRYYAVTCHHVLSAFLSQSNREKVAYFPSIHSGPTVLQLHGQSPAGVHAWHFQSCREFLPRAHFGDEEATEALARRNGPRPDVAIADITRSWPVLSSQRNALAIDLDTWSVPDWSDVQDVWMAFGFPDEHKSLNGNLVAAPMTRISAKLESALPSDDKASFILCSTLDAPHGYGFSGVSGGPIVVAHRKEDRYAFVGITYEGAPSTAKPPEKEDLQAFTQPEDIVIYGNHLTPERFRGWLEDARYGVEVGLGEDLPQAIRF